MAKRTIHGAVRLGGNIYLEGQEDELAKEIPAASVAQLKEDGVISGEWSGAKSAPKSSKTAEGDLAEDFPGRAALTEAGVTTRAAAAKLSREELVALKGIGEKTADEILAELK